MRDRDVRAVVLKDLAAAHAGEADTRIVEEMGVWAGSARIDVAVINGEICGYELKSERDNLLRLPLQADIYNLVFDRVSLVTTRRHLDKAAAILPEWWGLFTIQGDEELATCEVRAPQRNEDQDPFVIAQMLWKEEAVALLAKHGLADGFRSKRASEIQRRLAERLSLADLTAGVRLALKSRADWLR